MPPTAPTQRHDERTKWASGRAEYRALILCMRCLLVVATGRGSVHGGLRAGYGGDTVDFGSSWPRGFEGCNSWDR